MSLTASLCPPVLQIPTQYSGEWASLAMCPIAEGARCSFLLGHGRNQGPRKSSELCCLQVTWAKLNSLLSRSNTSKGVFFVAFASMVCWNVSAGLLDLRRSSSRVGLLGFLDPDWEGLQLLTSHCRVHSLTEVPRPFTRDLGM